MSLYDWNINVPRVRTTLYMGCRRVSANDTTPPVRLGLSAENCLCFCAGSTHVSKAVPPQRAGKKQGRDRHAGFPSVTAASPSESRRDEELDENYLIRRSRKRANELWTFESREKEAAVFRQKSIYRFSIDHRIRFLSLRSRFVNPIQFWTMLLHVRTRFYP